MMVRFLRNVLARRWIRRRIARRIYRCFDGVDLTRHEFVYDGQPMRTSEGATRFYSAEEVDIAISRINELLRELRS